MPGVNRCTLPWKRSIPMNRKFPIVNGPFGERLARFGYAVPLL
jgi:hypothetical protein